MVIKSLSLSTLVWAFLGDWSLQAKGESYQDEFIFHLGFWKIHSVQEFCYEPAWGTTSFSHCPSLCGRQVVRACVCVSLVFFGDFGLISVLCSFLHTWPSLAIGFGPSMMGAVGVEGWAGCLLPRNQFSFSLLWGGVGKFTLIDGVIERCFGDIL